MCLFPVPDSFYDLIGGIHVVDTANPREMDTLGFQRFEDERKLVEGDSQDVAFACFLNAAVHIRPTTEPFVACTANPLHCIELDRKSVV